MTVCTWCDSWYPETQDSYFAEDDKRGDYPCCSESCRDHMEEDDAINTREQKSLALNRRYQP